MIEFDIDWYGTYNRRSAIADYLELMALGGARVSIEDLADRIRDSGWTLLLRDKITDGDPETRDHESVEFDDTDLAESQDEAMDRADDVRNVLLQRKQLLGGRYPFEVDTNGYLIEYTNQIPQGPYLAFLAITICHASGIDGLSRLAAYVFEDSLETSLAATGLATSCLGRASRESNDFATTLVDSCARVGLTANPALAPYRTFANEEGSDTISNWFPQDTRVGGIQFVGQATCGKSNSWKAKLMEPAVGHWEDWLGRRLAPVAFLSVPHHVEEDTRSYLVTVDRKRDVLDRVRLSMVNRALSGDEIVAIQTVIAAGAAGL